MGSVYGPSGNAGEDMNTKDYNLLKYVETLLERNNIVMKVCGPHFTLIHDGQRMGVFDDLNEIYQFVTGFQQGIGSGK